MQENWYLLQNALHINIIVQAKEIEYKEMSKHELLQEDRGIPNVLDKFPFEKFSGLGISTFTYDQSIEQINKI